MFVFETQCINNAELTSLCSMKTKSMAEKLYLPKNIQELCALLNTFSKNGTKYVLFGNMSNVVLPEKINVPVILTTNMKKWEIKEENEECVHVFANCGVHLTTLSFEMCKMGYSGLEFSYGIPGSVGGGVYMNAGAYGGELCDVIKSVQALDDKGNVITLTNKDCNFDYRHSIFKDNGFVILGATFVLQKKNASECLEMAKDFMGRRKEKQPLEYPSCGSAFKRPKDNFAGALIENCNLKGYSVGDAQVSEKHAGFVVNKGNATQKDLMNLMANVRRIVKEKTGVLLESEILFLSPDGEYLKL